MSYIYDSTVTLKDHKVRELFEKIAEYKKQSEHPPGDDPGALAVDDDDRFEPEPIEPNATPTPAPIARNGSTESVGGSVASPAASPGQEVNDLTNQLAAFNLGDINDEQQQELSALLLEIENMERQQMFDP